MQAIGNLLSQTLPATQDEDSQPHSRGLPTEWIAAAESVFEQLAIHYGAARMAAHWAGINPEKSKIYWARRLMALERRNIGFALSNLPDMPPTVDEFCTIARRCPARPFAALTHKDSEEEKDRRRARVEAIKNSFSFEAVKP